MDRKQFIGAAGTFVAALMVQRTESVPSETTALHPFKVPPYLKSGDSIGITAPAGFIVAERLQPAVKVLQSWGYKIKFGNTIGKKSSTFGGTDEERAADLQSLLDDPAISAIMCARGGYGVVRIIDSLNWDKFRAHPKWVIGFSDITVLHNHIHRNCAVASIHSKMTNSFPDDLNTAETIQQQTIDSIRDAISGRKMEYSINPQLSNRAGTADGVLTGGNLKLLETLSGTPSDIDTRGKILFVEDTGEYLYSIDRMFWNLKRTGKLSGLKGLIVGGFVIKPDDVGEEFGKTLEEIVLEKILDYTYPVCFGFPVGHQRNNFALKCGMPHRLIVDAGGVNLIELS
ncbi:MAG: LD-carboxypeptidase [Chitinophagaceae bacterium]